MPMLRTIYSPTDGSDVSASVRSVLLATQQPVLCNLYSFCARQFWSYNPFNYIALWTFTDFDVPISLDYVQLYNTGAVLLSNINNPGVNRTTYVPGNTSGTAVTFLPRWKSGSQDGGFKHSGLTYEVGLAANDVDVTWFLDDNVDYFSGPFNNIPNYPALINPPVSILSMRQAMAFYRAFDDCPFWIHRAIFSDFPKNGGTLLGTTLMWRGFIRKTEAAADYLKISLGSLMQILQDTPVPSQLIQPNARTNPYLPNPNLAGSTIGPYPGPGTITRIGPKTYTVSCTGTVAANQLVDCWVCFWPAGGYTNFAPQSGLPPMATPGWRIQSNTASSGGHLNITFYDPPIVPGNVENINLYSPNSQNVGAPGWPYVPPPEAATG
jgi:hypothetical protein